MRTINPPAALLAAIFALAASSASGQVSFPYTNDFSSVGLDSPTIASHWSLGTGVYNYSVSPGGANVTSTTSKQISGVGSPGFVVSTHFTLNVTGSDSASASTIGFGILGSSATFLATGSDSYYLADWTLNTTAATKGQLRILSQGTGVTLDTTTPGDSDGGNANGSSVVAGATYELRLTGTYEGTTLTLTLNLYDSSGALLGTGAIATDSSPLSGSYFGFRNRAGANSGSRSVSYDDFLVFLPDPAPQPPVFVLLPKSQSWLTDANVPFSASASGVEPISYQWRFNGNPILDATNTTYVVSNAQSAQAGSYSVIVSNAIGTNTSPDAVLTMRERVEHTVLTRLWSLSPTERSYLTDGDSQRGLAYNAASNHVLVLARTTNTPGPANIFVMDGDTGAELWQMTTDLDMMAGTLWGNLVGVAEDGVVYAVNVVQNPAIDNFRIYRWANDTSGQMPDLAYDGTMNVITQRWGDTLAVRGSGPATQIIVASQNTHSVAVFTTTDGINFTPVIMTVTNVGNGAFAEGLAFGAADTFWGKAHNGALYHCRFDLGTGTAYATETYPAGANTLLGSVGPIASQVPHQVLAGVSMDFPDNVHLYNVADLNALPGLAEQELFPTDNPNTRFTGALAFGNNRLYALGTANGILAFSVDYGQVLEQIKDPPTISSQPVSVTNWTSLSATFSVVASGYQPLAYQWYHNSNAVPQATNSVLVIANSQPSDAGSYSVVVTNTAGSITSSNALLTLKPVPENGILTRSWALSAGSQDYLTTGNFQRGMAYNPVSQNLVLVSRAGGSNSLVVLNSQTGAEVGRLNTNDIFGGTLAVNGVGIGDDGVIYVANLVTDAQADRLKIYRWANDDPATTPTLAYEGGPGNNSPQRWGDTLAVRGSGANTQIIATSLNTNTVAIFTTADGTSFVAHYLVVSGAPAGWLNQGLAFGEGDTFWAKSTTASLLLCAFNLNSDTASLSNSYPAPAGSTLWNVGPVGYSPSRRLVVGIGLDTPDNVQLYKTADAGASLLLVEQEFFPTDLANSAQAGAVAFGTNRLYVLDANNGILAFDLDSSRVPFRITQVNRSANEVTLEWESQPDASYQVQYKDSLPGSGWSDVGGPVNATGFLSSVVLSGQAAGAGFYRVQGVP